MILICYLWLEDQQSLEEMVNCICFIKNTKHTKSKHFQTKKFNHVVNNSLKSKN